MLDYILSMLRSSIDAASTWFLQIFESLDGNWYGFIITMFTVFLVGRFIIGPLFGHTWGSDMVGRERRRSEASAQKERAERNATYSYYKKIDSEWDK